MMTKEKPNHLMLLCSGMCVEKENAMQVVNEKTCLHANNDFCATAMTLVRYCEMWWRVCVCVCVCGVQAQRSVSCTDQMSSPSTIEEAVVDLIQAME
jgi:hypothetical protein